MIAFLNIKSNVMIDNDNNISVALATYNGAKFLREQLYSIVNQTLKPKEIVVVDDCSKDDTIKVIKEFQEDFPSVRLFVNDQNKGPIKTFEIAISKCKYNYIALCDQDDIWELDKLEISLSELKVIEKVDAPCFVFTDLKMIDSNGMSIGTTFWESQRLDPLKMDFRRSLFLNSVTGCTVVFNRKMKDLLVNIPKEVEMHDYWISLIGMGLGVSKPLYSATVNYRSHENSVTVKDKISYFQRFIKFISVLGGFDKEYMKSNFNQAALFLELYGDKLTVEKRKQLVSFVDLKDKNSLYRILYVGFFKYFYIYSNTFSKN